MTGYAVKATILSSPARAGSVLVALAGVAAICAGTGIYHRDLGGARASWEATGRAVFEDHEYWRLYTSLLIHVDMSHLAVNAIYLALSGYLAYGYFGAAVHPIGSTLFGGAVTALALLTYPPEARLVGASGLIFMLAGFWLASYLLVERRISIGRRLLRCLGMSLLLLVPGTVEPTVSYQAHAIGFVLGALSGVAHFVLRKQAIRDAEVIVPDIDL